MNINDPKYLALRKKLDEMGYTQTLHPDSVELAGRLFRDQMQTLAEIEKYKKKKPEKEGDAGNSMMPVLYGQIDKLTAEKEQLEKQVEMLRNGSAMREPDERTLKLQAFVNDLRDKLEAAMRNFAAERQELERELEEVKYEKGQLLNENQRLKNISNSSLGKYQEENHELTLMIQRKNKEIKSLEESNGKSRIRIQILEKTVEELRNSTKDNKEEGKNESGRMMIVLKQELAESQSRFRQTKKQLEDTQEEIDGLRRQLRRAKDQMALIKSDQTKNRTLDNMSRAGTEKIQAKLEEARIQLSQSNEEIRSLKSQVSDYESYQQKSNSKMKQLTNKVKFLSQQNNDLQSQIQLISGKLTTNMKRVRQLQNASASYEKQLKQAMESGKSSSLEKLQALLEEQRSKSEQLRKDIVLNEREYKVLEEEVKILREQGEQRTIERDKALVENKKLHTIISEGNKNLQVVQFQKEELMKENRELKSGKQQIASSDYAAKSQLFLLKEKNQSYQVQLQELRGVIHGSQSANAQLQSQIARLQTLLSQSQQKNRQVFEDNRLMVGQLKILEQRKNELHEKVKDLQQRQQLKNDNTTVAKKQFDRLFVEYQQIQNQLAKKDQAIRIIDAERDELQNILDQQTEEKARIQEELQALKKQSRRYNKQIDQREYNLNDLKVKISRVESQRDDLDKQLHRQVQQTCELKERLSVVEVANRQLQNEINNLVISNKQNQREVQRARIRVSELDRKLKERSKDYEQQREKAMSLNILNNQLQVDMEQDRCQIVRLQAIIREIEDANHSNYQHLEEKDKELQYFAHFVQDMKRQENQYRMEIQSYQRQLENLSQEYESLKAELLHLNGDREVMRAERNWKKEITSKSQDWRAKQEQRYQLLQQDYNRKVLETNQLKQRLGELQAFLSEQRAKNFKMSRQLQHSQQIPLKSILVQSRVQRYQSQNENISNLHSRHRNDSLPNLADSGQCSQAGSFQSAVEKIRQLQEMYIQTTKPIMRS